MSDQAFKDSCASCGKESFDLKQCDKCYTVFYCNRDCRKKHHKIHKKDCADWANNVARSAADKGSSSTPGARQGGATNIHTINDPNFVENAEKCDMLHKEESESKVFDLLVDIWRMRMEDEYKFSGDIIINSPMGEAIGESEADALEGFKSFLEVAEINTPEILPKWWNDKKKLDCLDRADKRDHWSNVHDAIEKSDIQEHYHDNLMPWKIRRMAAKVYGKESW